MITAPCLNTKRFKKFSAFQLLSDGSLQLNSSVTETTSLKLKSFLPKMLCQKVIIFYEKWQIGHSATPLLCCSVVCLYIPSLISWGPRFQFQIQHPCSCMIFGLFNQFTFRICHWIVKNEKEIRPRYGKVYSTNVLLVTKG